MSNLECRVQALEKANRRWSYATALLGGVLLIGLATAMTMPDQVPDLLQTRRIEVLSPEGKPVIELSADSHGSTLTLLGQSQTSRHTGQASQRTISLAADKEGARLVLMKHKEAPLLTAQVDDAGSALVLFDGRQPSQEPRGIHLRSACPTEHTQGGTAVMLTHGWQKDKDTRRAGLFLEEPPGSSFLFLGGQQGKAAKVNVNQQSGKVDFVHVSRPFESETNIWSTP